MMKTPVARPILGAVSLVGAGLSTYLLRAHIAVKSGFEADGFCHISAAINCDAAAGSSYSEIAGVPIALLGLAGYVATLVLLVFPAARIDALSMPGVLQTFFTTSVVYSIFLALVSILILPAICPACIGLYLVNVAGLLGTSAWTRQNPLSTLRAQVKRLGPALVRPETITFALTAALITALGTGYVQSSIAERRIAAKPQPKVDHERATARHSPKRGREDARLQLVVFSDFQCPYCSNFAKTLTFAEETFGSKLRVEFRHFPLPFHPFAPVAAAFSVCAHRRGRFWEFHDALFADPKRVNPDELRTLSDELGLDSNAMAQCAKDPSVKTLIEADRAAGRQVGVTGTPAFVVNGTFYNGALPLAELTRVLENELNRTLTSKTP